MNTTTRLSRRLSVKSARLGAVESGDLRLKSERSHTQQTRFEYQYDEEGNWTERVAWSRSELTKPFDAPTSSAVRSVITLRITGDYHSLGRPVWGLE